MKGDHRRQGLMITQTDQGQDAKSQTDWKIQITEISTKIIKQINKKKVQKQTISRLF